MKQFILTYILVLIFSIKMSAQFVEVKKSLTIDDGLSQNSVYAIHQDNKGFIWFGTKNGLNRFDGYEFKIFKNDINDKSSLSGNFVKAIIEDENDCLWIGTGRGLSKYNLATGQFEQDQLPEGLKQTLKDKHCTSLAIDRKKTLWIGTRAGVYSLSLLTNEFTDYSLSSHPIAALSNKYIYRIFEDSAGRYWFGTFHNGLFYFDATKGKLTSFKPEGTFRGYISGICEISPGKILVGTFQGGINIFDVQQNTITWLDLEKHNYDGFITQVLPYRAGEYLIVTNRSIFIFKSSDHSFRKIWSSISKGSPSSICLDRSGVLWIGTSGHGIFRLKLKYKNFKTVTKATPNHPGLSFASVRSFFLDENKELWVAGHGGLNKMDYTSNDNLHWENIEMYKRYNIYACVQDPVNKEKYWLGFDGGGLHRFDRISSEDDYFFNGVGYFKSFEKVSEVYKILISSTKELYFGTDKSLIHYDPQTEKFSEYLHNPAASNTIVNRKYKAIYEDNKGRIWIGSDRDGFSILDPTAGSFQNFRTDDCPYSLSANRVNSFCETKDGVMWIGTENGLNKFIPKEKQFQVYTSKDGLADDYIYGVLDDDEGNLWLSTNKGITRFNPESELITNFDVSYGLQSNEFNTVSYYKSPSGEMFFGGINGFTAFFPEEIQYNEFEPEVILTKFKKNNREFITEKSISYGDLLELTYKDHFFSFEFASTDFTNPERNKFRYSLSGFDDRWIYTDAFNRNANFTNIDPGTYELKIAASNSDGIWSENVRKITICIHPAFWDTFWFKSLSLISLLTIIILLYGSRIKRLKVEREIQRELSGKLINSQEKEREKISHSLHDELGQELLVVRNMLLSAKQKNTYQKQLDDSISMLSKSIENISNISHLLHPSELKHLGLTLALESMIDLVQSASDIKIKSHLLGLDEFFNKDQRINVFRIVQESLNNIIKHSTATEASVNSTIEGKRLTIMIADNGKGFNTEKPHFFGTNRPHLGLAGMKERVNMLKGKVKIDSAPGKGTRIILNFQITDNEKEA